MRLFKFLKSIDRILTDETMSKYFLTYLFHFQTQPTTAFRIGSNLTDATARRSTTFTHRHRLRFGHFPRNAFSRSEHVAAAQSKFAARFQRGSPPGRTGPGERFSQFCIASFVPLWGPSSGRISTWYVSQWVNRIFNSICKVL